MKMRQISAAVALAMLATGSAVAKEGGDQYPNGVENWLSGAAPPPGNYFLNYVGHYRGELRDGDGDKVPGASVDAWFDALRFIKMTDTKVLGGDWGMHLIVPLVHQEVKLGGDSKTVTGLGDITFNPLIIAWHTKNLHWLVALDLNMPTGKYKSGEPRKSIGANYWSLEPIFAATWLSDDGWEVSGKFMYNIKRKNKDFRLAPGMPKMDYESGDEFHMDYLVGKHFGPWAMGLSGYYLKQTENDKLEGETLPEVPGVWSRGRKGEVFAIGPSVSYTNKSGTTFIAQWQHETEAENRFRGDKAWFKLVVPF
ncbi:putative regulatory protein [Azoarcus sp. CIB]|uniref:SphA family protein n=1 Tax=Aromatoleum sp. (strain CIB) TaxID=198107 RepID=UPI00067E515F|nr:transporter [Azoarcus sp. CIB]AKU12756.1 putative regulatory protein [Azoarcus sp. CIB]